jgi:Xaa-Pro aminopeptidase
MINNHLFDAATYAARRDRLQKEVGSGIILLPGNDDSPMNYLDNTYPYRQDSHFLYFAGISQPGLALVIDIDENTTTLYGDDLSIDYIVWMGPQSSMAELAHRIGVSHTAPYAALTEKLRATKAGQRKIHYLPPYRGDNSIRLSRWLDTPVDQLAGGVSESLIKAIVAQRNIKSDEEVAELEKAVNFTGDMHLAVMKAAKPGITEAALAGIAAGIAQAHGTQPGYSIILTINGQTLHNHYHGNTLTSGKLVLGDFGADSHMFYAGDITRTFPVDPTFTSRQRDIYNLVLQMQLSAIDALKPGARYYDVHLLSARVMVEGLKSLGLMKGDTDEAIAGGAFALFFPHGLGHMLGLDVHDMEDVGEQYVGYAGELERSKQFGLKSLRLGRALQPGFVLTVEPGVYFIPELMDLWQHEDKYLDFINYDKLQVYRDFGGVRIEDNILITATGHRILGNPIPKTIDEVEEVRKAHFPLLVS